MRLYRLAPQGINMADKINPKRTALALGTFAALVHLIWVIAVAAGFAQWWLDFKLGLHFIDTPAIVTAFSPVTAGLLLLLSFGGGYIAGWVFGWIWNWAGKRR